MFGMNLENVKRMSKKFNGKIEIEITPRSPMSVALRKRHGSGRTIFRDKRERRAKEHKNDWKKEE